MIKFFPIGELRREGHNTIALDTRYGVPPQSKVEPDGEYLTDEPFMSRIQYDGTFDGSISVIVEPPYGPVRVKMQPYDFRKILEQTTFDQSKTDETHQLKFRKQGTQLFAEPV